MDHNDIDRILKGHGWIYDNGWQHDSKSWDSYVNAKDGSPEGYVVVLVNNGDGRVIELRRGATTEIWTGPIVVERDIDELLAFLMTR